MKREDYLWIILFEAGVLSGYLQEDLATLALFAAIMAPCAVVFGALYTKLVKRELSK